MKIYLTGSLRNESIPEIGRDLRTAGHEVFDDWYAAGPEADDCWKEYELSRGRTYAEALHGFAAQHVFEFDRYHLNAAECGVLVLPAGRSGHLELGYLLGQAKPGYILKDKEDTRWDVMYCFANKVVYSVDELIGALQ